MGWAGTSVNIFSASLQVPSPDISRARKRWGAPGKGLSPVLFRGGWSVWLAPDLIKQAFDLTA